jgi:hypothetical protein
MNLLSSTLCALIQTIAVTGGTIHPMDGTQAYVGTVLITDGVITELGPQIETPDGALVVQAAGLHVVPGLIDGMMHHDGEHDSLYLNAGVVLGRDMGNDLGRILFSKARNLRAGAKGPRLFISGAVLDGMPPITTKAAIVRTADESTEKIARLVDLGVDFIATHGRVNEDSLRGAAIAAHASGRDIWGPVPQSLSLAQAVDCGLDGVLGLDAFLSDPYGWVSEAEPDFSEGIKTALSSGLLIMPVLNSVASRIKVPTDPASTLSLLSPHYAAQWNAELASRERLGGEAYYQKGALAMSRQERLIADLYGAGVHLLPGSAAPNPWVAPGDGLHDELRSWVKAGIPAAEVLRFATSRAAAALGLSDSHGELRTGLYGDVLVVDSDPRVNIETLKRPRFVIIRGEVIPREILDERVEELRTSQLSAKAASALPIEVEAPITPEGTTILSGVIESEAYGERVSKERYAIVELPAGEGTAYCSKMVIPASATESGSLIDFQQTIAAKKVTSFKLAVRSKGALLEVSGIRVGGQLRVERRVDGIFFDNNSSSESVAVVDTGSALTLMALAHTRGVGEFKAIYFEELDPIVANWSYSLGETGIHSFQTGEGPMVALFSADGSLDKMERTRGNTVVRHIASETELHGGDGVQLISASTPPKNDSEEEGSAESSEEEGASEASPND